MNSQTRKKLLIVRSIATEGAPFWQPFTNICQSRRLQIRAVGRIRGKLPPNADVAVMVLEGFAPLSEYMLRRSVAAFGPEFMIIPFERNHRYCIEWDQTTDDFAETVRPVKGPEELAEA